MRTRLPEVSARSPSRSPASVQRLRDREPAQAAGRRRDAGLGPVPDGARRSELDVETAAATLGAVCKYREDADRVRDSLGRLLAG